MKGATESVIDHNGQFEYNGSLYTTPFNTGTKIIILLDKDSISVIPDTQKIGLPAMSIYALPEANNEST